MAAFQRFGSPPYCVNDFSGSFLFHKREKLGEGKASVLLDKEEGALLDFDY
jgi:hypothetical protein